MIPVLSLRSNLLCAVLLTLTSTASCALQAGAQPARLPATSAARAPSAGLSSCGEHANHCLPADIYLVGEKAYEGNFNIAYAARQMTPPGPTGEATFVRAKNGAELVTKFFYATRPAQAADLAIGRVVLVSPNREKGIIRAPKTAKQALDGQWLVVRILDISTLQSGYVLTAGNRRVALNGIRVFDGDPSSQLTITGDFDEHFLSASHYHIATNALPEKGYRLGHVGLAIGDSGTGDFYNARTGSSQWTSHAWRTRPAGAEDLVLGNYVFYAGKRAGGLYRRTKSRQESLHSQWFIAKIVDVAKRDQGVVKTSSGHDVRVDALRVMR